MINRQALNTSLASLVLPRTLSFIGGETRVEQLCPSSSWSTRLRRATCIYRLVVDLRAPCTIPPIPHTSFAEQSTLCVESNSFPRFPQIETCTAAPFRKFASFLQIPSVCNPSAVLERSFVAQFENYCQWYFKVSFPIRTPEMRLFESSFLHCSC